MVSGIPSSKIGSTSSDGIVSKAASTWTSWISNDGPFRLGTLCSGDGVPGWMTSGGVTRTRITTSDEVRYMRGKATNGRTTDSTTCDATRSELIPLRPTETATTTEGIRLIHRVMSRRKKG